MGPANDAGASTDCVSQAGPKEVHTGQIEGDEIQWLQIRTMMQS